MQSAKSNSEADDNAAIDFIFDSLIAKKFLRTFSYREILTALTLSMCYMTVYVILEYYREERFYDEWASVIRYTAVILMLIANHIYYRFEHGRSNNLMGRTIYDLLFLVCFYVVKVAHLWITERRTLFLSFKSIPEGMQALIVVVVAIFIFEFLVSLLKYLLRFARCPVL